MNIQKIHLIKGKKDKNIFYYYPTFSLITVSDILYDILTKIINGESYETIKQDYNIETEAIHQIISKLNDVLTAEEIAINNKISINAEHNINDNRKRNINRITLHVSNDCNLRCKYCYANGGNYNLPKGLMNYKTADEFISFCIDNFDYIDGIVFFGGEPLLNVEIIDYICSRFYKLKEDNIINYIPNFGIITNGTIMNDKVLSILKKYIQFITVSIDGSKNVNDYNRQFANNEGSYDKISKFIKTIKTESEIKIKYEATYTQFHVDSNISETDVQSFLKQEFDLKGTLVNDTLSPPKRNNVDSESVYYEGFEGVLFALVSKKRKEMCPVGRNIVAISTIGDIYPCHMNNGLKHLSLGSISGDNIFNNPHYYYSKFPYLNSVLKFNEPCISCWAQAICGGCAMKWFFDDNINEYKTIPNSQLCVSNQKHIEKILLRIAEIKSDEKEWANMKANLEQMSDY
jgi:uncharacterized protein